MARGSWAELKYRYGITKAQYLELLHKQEGKCACCYRGETKIGRGGSVRNLSVDHDHTTGQIRGLLCDACNRTLGFVRDDPALLRRLAAYVEVHCAKHADLKKIIADVMDQPNS